MLSTIDRTFEVIDNHMVYRGKSYPNYCGIEDVGFIFHNTWTDPELEYKGKKYNANVIQDTLWGYYTSENPEPNYYDKEGKISKEYKAYEDVFANYVYEHKEDLYELLER